MKKEIYFCDDDRTTIATIQAIMSQTDFNCSFFSDPLSMINHVNADFPGIIVTDLIMPVINGIEVVKRIKNIDEEIPVIVLTGNGDISSTVEALQAGAFDFLEKPLNREHLLRSAQRAIDARLIKLENELLRKSITGGKVNFIGHSRCVERARKALKNIGQSSANVVIVGETGTGKELSAKFIHQNSSREKENFVAVNCGGMTESLMDSELFGHEKGSFTGADSQRIGLIEYANRGTIFLDEIDSMPLSQQAKLLRVIEEKSVKKIGSNINIPVDVRIIAASQVDLSQLVHDDKFREDLYYRLNVVPVTLPPLRSYREDIPIIFNHFINKISVQNDRELITVEDSIIIELMQRDWPGNVRQLRNVAERLVLTGSISDKGYRFDETTSEFDVQGSNGLSRQIEAFEMSLIDSALHQNKGHIKNTAQNLNVSVKMLNTRMAKYELDKDSYK